jgi:acyl-CoA thioesterase I
MRNIRWRVTGLMLAALLALSGCGGTPRASAQGSAAPKYALTYAAVGASDAFGVGTDDPAAESWPSVLARLLSTHTHLINLGIPGVTVAQAQSAEAPIALAAQPQVITIWLAVNDIQQNVPLATYRVQLLALIQDLVRGTHARIYVGNVPDLTQLPYFHGLFQNDDPAELAELAATVTSWNAAIAAICVATGAHLVDIHAGFAVVADHPEYISGDGLHPSAAGAAVLADLFNAAIAQG